MVPSNATSVDQYLAELPADRRDEISKVRNLVLENLPDGLEEAMGFGMIVYQVPERVVSETYNGQPLMYAAIANQKHHISLYLMSIYAWDDARVTFENAWMASGKKLDVGKACIRFKSFVDIPQEVVARAIAAISMQNYVDRYLEVRGSARKMRVKDEI